jgi:hypothetical protein
MITEQQLLDIEFELGRARAVGENEFAGLVSYDLVPRLIAEVRRLKAAACPHADGDCKLYQDTRK